MFDTNSLIEILLTLELFELFCDRNSMKLCGDIIIYLEY